MDELLQNKTLQEIRAWILDDFAEEQTISADRLTAITPRIKSLVESGTEGSFVELGCHRGAMTLWVRSVLDVLGETEREIHIYDSFQGLPAPDECDTDYAAEGDLVTSEEVVLNAHAHWGKKPPVVHAGWFDNTLPKELPEAVAFGYLDGDFYSSIMTSLTYCIPRMAPGGVLVIDDYADLEAHPGAWNGLPGVKLACDEYFGDQSPVEAIVLDNSDLPYGFYRHPAEAHADPVAYRVKRVLAYVKGIPFPPEKISDDQQLRSEEIGLDPASLLDTALRLEVEFGLRMLDSEVLQAELKTVGDLARLVADRLKREGYEFTR